MKTHILCLGDSNTHGYCADPKDNADGGIRFNEDERWTCRLQTALGDKYLVTEEGLSGRTTVFADPIHESMDALSVAYPLLKSHEVIDLLIIMLGTNDVKERFNANAACIGAGMERLIQKCKTVDCWGGKEPNILVVSLRASRKAFTMRSWVTAVWRSPRALPAGTRSLQSATTSIFWMLKAASSTRSTSCT